MGSEVGERSAGVAMSQIDIGRSHSADDEVMSKSTTGNGDRKAFVGNHLEKFRRVSLELGFRAEKHVSRQKYGSRAND